MTSPFEAMYTSDCAECGATIYQGDEIIYSESAMGYVHYETCSDQPVVHKRKFDPTKIAKKLVKPKADDPWSANQTEKPF